MWENRPRCKKDAYKLALEWLYNAINAVAPGKTTADIASAFPPAEEFGYESEEAAMCLQWGHGLGLSLYERPTISRMFSLEHPYPIQENSTFALETFSDAGDGINGVRIEEMVQVTKDGREVLTRYPIDDFDALVCW